MVEVQERLSLIQALVPYAGLTRFVRTLHARNGGRDVPADDTLLRLLRCGIVGVSFFFRQLSLCDAHDDTLRVHRRGQERQMRTMLILHLPPDNV